MCLASAYISSQNEQFFCVFFVIEQAVTLVYECPDWAELQSSLRGNTSYEQTFF